MRAIFAAASLFVIGSSVAQAAQFEPKAFLDERCSSCHGTEVYSRADHRVKNFAGLVAQVTRCNNNVGTGLTKDEIKSLSTYLNDQYYKF
jgi:hypothetical protein